jgi:hypothetical protein
MRGSKHSWFLVFLVGIVAASISTLAGAAPMAQQTAPAPGTEVTVVNASAGSCAADFIVKDASGRGIYDAKIRIQIKYGFMGVRKVDATVGTNYEGKARIEGLPERIKGAAEFTISLADLSKSLPYDPLNDCHPHHEVTLGDK